MSTWSQEQIVAAAAVKVEVEVDKGWVGVDAAIGPYRQLRDRLVSEFGALGLDVDLRDVQLDKTLCKEKAQIHLRAYWMPKTRMVEFYGGPKDGETKEIPVVGNIVLTALKEELPDKIVSSDDLNKAYAQGVLQVYRLAGWNDTSRHWVYTMVHSHGDDDE